jgi:ABC-type nitrate/sulfonate/bicarbonate transport system substrate-binding protein
MKASIKTGWIGRLCGLSAVAVCAIAGAGAAAAMDDAPIRIAFPSGMNGQIVIAMEKAGIAEKVGLKAEYTSFQYGPPMMEALASGAIDAVVTSLMPVTSYAAKVPGDIKIVAMVGQSSHSLMVGKDSGVSTPESLAGKTVGVSFGSDSHLDTQIWLKAQGLAGKVSLVNIAPAELASSLASNSVDAIVIRQPQVLRLQTETGARILHSWPFRFVSIVKSKFIDDHPRQFAEYIEALREAIVFVAQNHSQSAKWFGDYLRTAPSIIEQVSRDDPLYEVRELDKIDIAVKPRDRDLIAQWSADAYAQGMIRKKVDLTTLFQN